jgi:hypothetical protein
MATINTNVPPDSTQYWFCAHAGLGSLFICYPPCIAALRTYRCVCGLALLRLSRYDVPSFASARRSQQQPYMSMQPLQQLHSYAYSFTRIAN